MNDPKIEWDQRYSGSDWAYGTAPNDFLRQVAGSIQGPVLCIGEGEGRNAVFLAERGLNVTALDMSAVGLEKTRRLAAERGVQVATVQADLSEYEWAEGAWGTVVAIWCHLPPAVRQRVHQGLLRGLRPGGRFVVEAYTPKQLSYGTGGPRNADWLYSAELLRRDFPGARFEYLEELDREVQEGRFHSGLSAVVQCVAVLHPPSP